MISAERRKQAINDGVETLIEAEELSVGARVPVTVFAQRIHALVNRTRQEETGDGQAHPTNLEEVRSFFADFGQAHAIAQQMPAAAHATLHVTRHWSSANSWTRASKPSVPRRRATVEHGRRTLTGNDSGLSRLSCSTF